MSPLVSIALPTYKPGRYLRPAVQSLLNQSMRDFELILIDDSGADPAVREIAALGDSRIIIIDDGQNSGLARRLNQAIDLAKGKYFARMDHDDICHPDRLAMQVAYLSDNPKTDLVATACAAMGEDDRLIGKLPVARSHEKICRRPWQGFYMPHPTWMGRLEWFRAHKYSQASPFLCEDQEMLLRTHAVSAFYCLPECLLAYRIKTKPDLWRRLKTRWSVFKMQLKHFFKRRDFSDLVLSCLSLLVRVLRDLIGAMVAMLGGTYRSAPLTQLSSSEREYWRAIISQLR